MVYCRCKGIPYMLTGCEDGLWIFISAGANVLSLSGNGAGWIFYGITFVAVSMGRRVRWRWVRWRWVWWRWVRWRWVRWRRVWWWLVWWGAWWGVWWSIVTWTARSIAAVLIRISSLENNQDNGNTSHNEYTHAALEGCEIISSDKLTGECVYKAKCPVCGKTNSGHTITYIKYGTLNSGATCENVQCSNWGKHFDVKISGTSQLVYD